MQVNQTGQTLYYEEKKQREAVKTLDKNAFLQLMIAQLRHQDPTSPMDTNKFIDQMASFTTLEQISNLNSNFEKLYSLQQFSYATSLMNCKVTLNQGDSLLTGVIGKVTMDSGGVKIWVDNRPYEIGQILAVEKLWVPEEVLTQLPKEQNQQEDPESSNEVNPGEAEEAAKGGTEE